MIEHRGSRSKRYWWLRVCSNFQVRNRVAQKRKTAVVPLESHFSWRKSARLFRYESVVMLIITDLVFFTLFVQYNDATNLSRCGLLFSTTFWILWLLDGCRADIIVDMRVCSVCRLASRQLVVVAFYSASALLAMQSAVQARGILSVCPSVTFRYCVQTNEDTIMRFAASGSTIPLVSGEVKFIRIFAGDHPQRGR